MDHTLKAFDKDLAALKGQVATIGALAQAEVADSIRALIAGDQDLARTVIDRDRDLDVLEVGLEETAIRLVALRQPVAGDLRQAVAALKMAVNLERVGDLAKNIAKRTLVLGSATRPSPLFDHIRGLGELVQRRLDMALRSYADQDLVRADDVWSADREIDEQYEVLFREVLAHMMSDPAEVAAGSQLLFVAKNLERIGDHATNIAEVVHYGLTGEQLTSRPKIETAEI